MTLIWLLALCAATFLLVSLYVWPMIVYGPRIVGHWRNKPEVKAIGGVLATACLGVAIAPLANAALISGASHAQVMADIFMGLSWS